MNERDNKLNNTNEPENFEVALAELEGIVKKLSSGELSLEESIKLFERGVVLSKYCNKKLEEAESKIRILVKDQKGEIQLEDFDVPDSNEKE
jgi:exodeoxyribonuclease VII small subunit